MSVNNGHFLFLKFFGFLFGPLPAVRLSSFGPLAILHSAQWLVATRPALEANIWQGPNEATAYARGSIRAAPYQIRAFK